MKDIGRFSLPSGIGAVEDVCSPAHRREGIAATDRLSVDRDVGRDAVVFLCAAPGQSETGNDLVENEDDALIFSRIPEGLEESRVRDGLRACRGSTMTAASSVPYCSIRRVAASVSLKGLTRTVSSRSVWDPIRQRAAAWGARIGHILLGIVVAAVPSSVKLEDLFASRVGFGPGGSRRRWRLCLSR